MKNMAPYQVLFPIGILSSFLAVAVWLVQDLNWFSSSAISIHSKLVVGGFLWSFIIGFLMTAVPKMTGTRGASSTELSSAALLVILQILFSWKIDARWFYGSQIILIFFLLFFAGGRFLNRQKPVPVFFSHIGFAVALALVGAFHHFRGNSFAGIHYFHVGTVLLLVLGIGTRFFSFLSGLPSEFESAAVRNHYFFHLLGGATVGLLFLAGYSYAWAYLALTVVCLLYLFFVWRIFRSAKRPSALKYGVRFVAFTIPLSFFLCWLRPDLYITWFHLLFIGCFGVITYAVATRVTLAHGAYSLDLELKSLALWAFMGFLFLAVVFRVIYGLVIGAGKNHFLHLAAIFWILAICSWCYSFAKKIIVPGKQNATC